MKKEHSAGAVIFFQNDKKREYLLLNYLGGHWGFPKGHIELYENPIKTAIREIKEETGLDIQIIRGFEKKITYSFYHNGEHIIKDVIFYLAKAKNQKVQLSDEHKGYVWLDFKSAYRLITYEKDILKASENFINKFSYRHWRISTREKNTSKKLLNKTNTQKKIYYKNYQTNNQNKSKSNQYKSKDSPSFETKNNTQNKKTMGFTLIELLITIAMILVIFSITSQIFKPSAYLQKTRDTQRIGDLKAIEMALKVYLVSTTTPSLGSTSKGIDEASPTIFISVPKEKPASSSIASGGITYQISRVSSSEAYKNDGTGWLPVNISLLPYPPLFAYPVDPINSYTDKFFYSYVFKRSSTTFELNANLEFKGYKLNGNEDKVSTDGGDNPNIYEVGNNLNLMPTTTNLY
jgi:prepilin-type N-terminal cleavage/methylation domain-containing protein